MRHDSAEIERIARALTDGRALERRLAVALVEEGLRLDQWRIMQALAERPGMSMGEITESLIIPQATTTRLVDELSDGGLVFRRPAPGDGRKVLIYLSRTGSDRLTRAAAVLTAVLPSGTDAPAVPAGSFGMADETDEDRHKSAP